MSIRPFATRTRSLLIALLLCAAAFPAGAAKRVLNGKIAFVSDRDGNRAIYAMNPDGSEQTMLTDGRGTDVDPAWSPDGKRIAFVRNQQIHVMNADGSGVIRLTQVCCNNLKPAWSPDGRLIAFESDRDSTSGSFTFEIYAMATDGSSQTRLTDFEGEDLEPAWSPDGRSIAFSCERRLGRASQNICIMNADGTNVRTLTDNARGPYDTQPSFSPDGTKIVFSRSTFLGDRDDVMVMNVDGSHQEKLANGVLSGVLFNTGTHPVYSPDGTKIAFAGSPLFSANNSIRVMDANGDNEVQITHNEDVIDEYPSWQRTLPADTVGVYVPSTGQWLLRNSNTAGNPDSIVIFGGQPGDLPVAGDWDGDGRTDIAVYRSGKFLRARLGTSIFCISCESLILPDPFDTVALGEPGDLPIAGDWNGDGVDDLGVFRPGDQGTFLLRVPEFACPLCFPPFDGVTTVKFVMGPAGVPIAGDWDGDGKDGVGVYEPASSVLFLSNGLAEPDFSFAFGSPGDRPLAGDWAGIGRDGVGVFQPPDRTLVLASDFTLPPDFKFAFGVSEGLPVAGHWTALPK